MCLLTQCPYQWAVVDEVLQTATMITTLLFYLGILHGPCKVHHEFLCDPIDTVGVFTFHFFIFLSTLLFQVCQAHGGCLSAGWVPLSFHKGKKLVIWGLAVLLAAWLHGLWDSSMESSFSASLAAHR